MIKKNGKDLIIIVILCVLGNLTSYGMSATNLDIAKVILFCLSVIFSIAGVICTVRLLVHVFSSPSEDIINVSRDKTIRKNKILIWVFTITFTVAIISFGIFYFWFI